MNDNECLKWCVNRYLNTSDCNPAISTKADKDFAEKTDFKGIKFPVKITDIQIIKKKTRISLALVSLVMKIRKNIQLMFQKDVAKKNMLIY